MTERLSEAPSEEELREYLLANVRMSAVAWGVRDSEFDESRLDPEYVESLRAVLGLGADRFIDRVVEALLDGLLRLNALSRDDPFWAGRTRSPTLHKLRDFTFEIAERDRKDVRALWTQAAFHLLHGSLNFGQKQWRRLYLAGEFDVSWPIFAAMVTELNAEATDRELAALLLRVDKEAEARSFFARFDATEDPWVLNFRERVLAALDM